MPYNAPGNDGYAITASALNSRHIAIESQNQNVSKTKVTCDTRDYNYNTLQAYDDYAGFTRN